MCENIEASLGDFSLPQKRIKDQVKLVTFVLITKARRDCCVSANLFSLLSDILLLLLYLGKTLGHCENKYNFISFISSQMRDKKNKERQSWNQVY